MGMAESIWEGLHRVTHPHQSPQIGHQPVPDGGSNLVVACPSNISTVLKYGVQTRIIIDDGLGDRHILICETLDPQAGIMKNSENP